MNNLGFDVGYKEYSINGDESRILRINTSDMNIITRMNKAEKELQKIADKCCLLYTSPSPRDRQKSRMPSSA